MYGYIYKCTYLKNNKIYIGQKTGNKIDEYYYGSGALWKKEVLKNCNPKKDIIREILDICETNEELNEKEKYWINFYNSTDPEIGYNIMFGGGPFNQEYRENMSKTISQLMESKERRNTISNTLKEYREENPFTEEHKNRIKEKAKGNKNGQYSWKKNIIGFDENNNPIRKNKKRTNKIGNYNIKLYCILNTGEKYYFNSIKEAGIWWHQKFKPFKHYSTCVYQRKILKSINNEELFYFDKTTRTKYSITNIKWYKVGDNNDSQS